MTQNRKILVTGGAGFIGSALIRHLLTTTDYAVVNVDKLTYASSPESLDAVSNSPRYAFEQVDVRDPKALQAVFQSHRPGQLIHLAAESHVDRSIDGPADFIDTNIVGTATLLEAARAYLDTLDDAARDTFRILHVSTDEVFGSLGDQGMFTEASPYDPSSPYAASKAAADHLVRAWHRTYGLPVLLSNSSNNYGPYQFPEKLIPLMIIKALNGEPLPVYGDGKNRRDWLHVDDHASALLAILERGRIGESYNVSAHTEKTNIETVESLCAVLDKVAPQESGSSHAGQMTFVEDRPGHDRRYALDATKLMNELQWRPLGDFETNLRSTVTWYFENRPWWEKILEDRYRGQRLGLEGSRRGTENQ